jgi:hypothetical protein
MYWNVRVLPLDEASPTAPPASGRFVLHRHRDADGPHLDLRLQQDGYLMGWRIAATSLEDHAWAIEKTPHPVHWLDQDGAAERIDAGEYAWRQRDDLVRELELRGDHGTLRLRVERVDGIPLECVRAVAEALAIEKADPTQAATLLHDGALARRRAIERFCGLSRELDGIAFDPIPWRNTLAGMSLAEIHAHLRTLEKRFDEKYPPQPTSRPEALDISETATSKTLDILAE